MQPAKTKQVTRPIPRHLWILLVVAVVHWLLLQLKTPVFNAPRPAPVSVEMVDPTKLEAIRNQWKQKDRALLLSDPSTPKDPKAQAPKDARFESDRNRSVERETRAAVTDVLPRAGQSGSKPERRAAPERAALPSLSKLGVPILKPGRQKPPVDETLPTPGQAGASQAILDRSIPLGSENVLNSVESVYYSFYSRLYEAVGPVWKSRVREIVWSRRWPAGEYLTQVELVLDTSGGFRDVRILRSSGIQEFDQAVIESWKRIQRFPNPPQGLRKPDGTVRSGWSFAVDLTSQPVFGSPERRY